VKKLLYLILILFFTYSAYYTVAQENIIVEKSELTEKINGKKYYIHFVKQGQTLFSIAKAYGVTVNDIFTENPDAQLGISPGQLLKIPYVKIPQSDNLIKDVDFFYHIVKKKETLYNISKKNSITIEEIEKINPELKDVLKEGQYLKIPIKKESETLEFIAKTNGVIMEHRVIKGETLYSIAKQYSVTIGEIRNANPGLSDIINIEQVINIPNQRPTGLIDIGIPSDSVKYWEHKVMKKENLYRIAKNYAVSIDSIKLINPGLTEDIKIEQIIKIPKNDPKENYIIHTSDKKDKLNRIAKKYEVSYEDVKNLNPNMTNKVIKGQIIKIPVEIKEKTLPDSLKPQKIPIEDIIDPCERYEFNKQKIYNVALMLPLYLEEIDSIYIKDPSNINELSKLRSLKFIQFYEGMMIAVDSIEKIGLKINLFVYDVDNNIEKTNKILQSSELTEMDLIIGPFFSTSFELVSDFAKTFQIKIVNPLSTRSEIIFDNPYVFKIKPDINTQIEQLISFIVEDHPKNNIIIVRHNKYQHNTESNFLKNKLNNLLKNGIYINNSAIDSIFNKNSFADITFIENSLIDPLLIKNSLNDSTLFNNKVKEIIYTSDSLPGLRNSLSIVRENIIIAISTDKVFTMELLTRLNQLRDTFNIILFGLPKWDNYDDIETEHLLNLKLHSLSPIFIDYDTGNIKQFILKFRSKYNTEPEVNKYAFDGFDIGWYFLNALIKYGRDFEKCLPYFQINLIQTKYNFNKTDNNGYENSFWNIYKYEDYKIINARK